MGKDNKREMIEALVECIRRCRETGIEMYEMEGFHEDDGDFYKEQTLAFCEGNEIIATYNYAESLEETIDELF